MCGQGGGGPNHQCGDQITSVQGPSGGAYIPSKVGLPGPISLVIRGRGAPTKYRGAHFTTTSVPAPWTREYIYIYFIEFERECHVGPHPKLERDRAGPSTGSRRRTSTARAHRSSVTVQVRAERALRIKL